MAITKRNISSVAVYLFSALAVAARSGAAPPTPLAGFPVTVSGGSFRGSPPAFGDLNNDGIDEIVVGGSDGKVYAYRGSGGLLWQYDTGTTGIHSKPAIADIDGDGALEVVVGAGSTAPYAGTTPGVYVLSHTGAFQCSFPVAGTVPGVYASAALADLDRDDGGLLEIAFAAWDHRVRVLNHDCSLKYQATLSDTIWSSPAIADLDRDGAPEVVVGSDHNAAGSANDGGQIHAFRNNLASELPGFPVAIDEVVYSSPAVGDIDGDGFFDIVVGTGWCWDRNDCSIGDPHPVTEAVYAWNRLGQPLAGWPFLFPPDTRYAFASPALADVDGDLDLEVVINATGKSAAPAPGWVYVLDGDATNFAGWPKQPVTPAGCDAQVNYGTMASPIVADLDGDAILEIALPSNWEVVVWNKSGVQLSRDDACPDPPGDWVLTTDNPVGAIGVGDITGDGAAELVATSANSAGTAGRIHAWSFGAGAVGAEKPWPQFRRSANNHARFEFTLLGDGFESGSTNAWDVVSP